MQDIRLLGERNWNIIAHIFRSSRSRTKMSNTLKTRSAQILGNKVGKKHKSIIYEMENLKVLLVVSGQANFYLNLKWFEKFNDTRKHLVHRSTGIAACIACTMLWKFIKSSMARTGSNGDPICFALGEFWKNIGSDCQSCYQFVLKVLSVIDSKSFSLLSSHSVYYQFVNRSFSVFNRSV